jgi:hypothetical protein
LIQEVIDQIYAKVGQETVMQLDVDATEEEINAFRDALVPVLNLQLKKDLVEYLQTLNQDKNGNKSELVMRLALFLAIGDPWSSEPVIQDRPRPRRTVRCGITSDIKFDTNPIDLWEMVFTDEVYDMIIENTNIYIELGREKLRSKGLSGDQIDARFPYKYQHVTRAILDGVIACNVTMGLVDIRSRLRDYWSENEFFRVEAVASIMPFEQYIAVVNNMHFIDMTAETPVVRKRKPLVEPDNPTTPAGPLHYCESLPEYTQRRKEEARQAAHKLQPLLDALNKAFKALYTPGSRMSYDEMRAAYKGLKIALGLRHYNPSKPGGKWAIELLCLCEAVTGVPWHIEFNQPSCEDAKREEEAKTNSVL